MAMAMAMAAAMAMVMTMALGQGDGNDRGHGPGSPSQAWLSSSEVFPWSIMDCRQRLKSSSPSTLSEHHSLIGCNLESRQADGDRRVANHDG